MPNTQIGIHRTSNKTIEFFSEYSALRQSAGHILDVSALLTIEGTNNFQDSYSPAIGAIVSRTIGDRGAIYVEPIWVNNTNTQPSELHRPQRQLHGRDRRAHPRERDGLRHG